MSEEIEKFCLLAKSAPGRAAVALIERAIASPKIFVFGALRLLRGVKGPFSDPNKPIVTS